MLAEEGREAFGMDRRPVLHREDQLASVSVAGPEPQALLQVAPEDQVTAAKKQYPEAFGLAQAQADAL